jgi:hypothetical protein
MTYTKQTWSDNNPSYPASAARFDHIEQGVYDAHQGLSVMLNAAAPPYNLTPSSSSPEVILQTAIDAAAAAATALDPVVVQIAPGTYTGCGIHDVPGSTTRMAIAWNRSNVIVRCSGRAVFKLAANVDPGSKFVMGFTNINPFTTVSADKQSNMIWEGIVFDGNSDNQTHLTNLMSAGFLGGTCLNSRRIRCEAINVFGTTDSPPGESFHFDWNQAINCWDIDCTVDGRGASTSTGFSFNDSFGGGRRGCVAYGLKFGHGFTAWQSGGFSDTGCYAYNCTAGAGFNYERCDNFTFDVIAGGRTPVIANGDRPLAAFADVSSKLTFSTTLNGAVSIGATSATLTSIGSLAVGDVISFNGREPREITSIATNTVSWASSVSSDKPLETGPLVAGYANGSTVYVAQVRVGNLIGVAIRGSQDFTGNAHATYNGTNVRVESNVGGTDARRPSANGRIYGNHRYATGAANEANNFTVERSSDGGGALDQLNIEVDGEKAIRLLAASDLLRLSDEVIVVTSTAAARTYTLPDPAAQYVPTGKRYFVVDGSQAAATNFIGVARAGTATYTDGGTQKFITTNGGWIEVTWTGLNWAVTRTSPADNAQPGEYAPALVLGVTTRAASANTAYVMRFVASKRRVITKIAFNVTVAASVDDACDVAIYDKTGARLGSAGATTGKLNSTGVKTVNLSASVTVQPGQVYYAAVSFGAIGGTGATLDGVLTGGLNSGVALMGNTVPNLEAGSSAASHPLPASLTPTTGAGSVPLVAVRE